MVGAGGRLCRASGAQNQECSADEGSKFHVFHSLFSGLHRSDKSREKVRASSDSNICAQRLARLATGIR